MKFTIDRIEGNYAVVELEDNTILDFPLQLIPSEAKEGDILEINILEKETVKRKQEIEERFKNLLNK